MRIKEKRAKNKQLFSWYAKLRDLDLKGKYLSHSYFYRVAGEDLPERHENRTRAKILWSLVSAVGVFFIVIYIATIIMQIQEGFSTIDKTNLFQKGNSPKIDFMSWTIFSLSGTMRFILTLISAGIGVFIGFTIDYKLHSITDGQKGDSRILTLKETKQLCIEIPDRTEPFKGIGGMPFSHYKDKTYIDTDTVNTCVIGTSRSGKGQTAVFSLIDNLSRAEIKSSMILNDPKTELFTASKETLEKRGYEVLAYNVLDPLTSMSDNPLSLIIKYWKRGDIDTATELTNTFTHTIYDDPNAGDNKYFNDNAEKAVNALIFTLLENAEKHKSYKKVTPNNIVELLTEIGSLNYKLDPEDLMEKNALDEFMSSLPTGNIAKKQYGSTKMGSDKARGNILSTALTGLNPFTLPKVAKMTTLSSLEYKSLGFPKFLDIQFDEKYTNKRIKVNFYHKDKCIHEERLKVEYKGFAELNFNCTLQSNDRIEFVYENKGVEEKASYLFKRIVLKDENGETVYRKETGKESLPEMEKYAEMIPDNSNTLEIENVKCHYSEKPVALFLLTPDFNSANHVLVSIFLKQIYTELSTQCVKTRGDKCHRRIHYILDEFGNMPTIADMDNIMTVTAGRNMLWDLFVQSYAQIYAKYGDDTGATIKENCQTHIYIMSTNEDTIEEFSNKVGHRTVQQEQAQTNAFGLNSSITRTVDQERVLTPERIRDFLEGETLVLRKLKRRDNTGKKVRPFSIFNTKKTVMPYAYQYLDEFNNGGDIQDIDIDSKHVTLDLKDYQLNYDEFLIDEEAKMEYRRQQQMSA